MTMQLEVESQEYKGFTSMSVERRLDALSGVFTFNAVSEDGDPLPFRGGESCRVIVDGEAVLTGFIEAVNVSYTPESHSISVSGRDKTADLIDSNLVAINDLKGAGITLEGLIKKVIDQLGMDVGISDEAGTLIAPFNAAEDVVGPDPGENAFDFLEKYARKRQVLLTSDSKGNVVITQSSGDLIPATLQMVKGSDNNNILQSNVSYNTTRRFNKYTFASAQGFVALNFAGFSDLAESVDQSGETTDPDIREGRQLVIIPETAASSEQNALRAQWEANIRKARGREYSVVVSGFRNQTGALWKVNTIVSVVDTFAGINSQMLINSVEFSFNLETGSTTSMTLLASNAYTLELDEPKTETVGAGLFG